MSAALTGMRLVVLQPGRIGLDDLAFFEKEESDEVSWHLKYAVFGLLQE